MEEFENAQVVLEKALIINPAFGEAKSMLKTIELRLN